MRRPTGWIARCVCGSVVGAVDRNRAHRQEANIVLSEWLVKGCTISPVFEQSWSVKLTPCRCEDG